MSEQSPPSTINISVFSTQPYDRTFLSAAFASHSSSSESSSSSGSSPSPSFNLTFHTPSLTPSTTGLVTSSPRVHAVCVFVNDALTAPVLDALASHGVRAILLRCAGYNNIDMHAARRLDLFVARVPAYSPAAVAEFTVALIQTLNRRTHKAYLRVREGNFALQGLLGHTLAGKTVGIVGTGGIGLATAKILGAGGFGCRVLGYDVVRAPEFTAPAPGIGGVYVDALDTLLARSDIVSLHCPLLPATRHIINARTLALMKSGSMLVNTSRGGLVDSKALIGALKPGEKHGQEHGQGQGQGQGLGGVALDVYEQEASMFYNDHSGDGIEDEIYQRLMTFPNVLLTGHQGFFTEEALAEIAAVTVENALAFAGGEGEVREGKEGWKGWKNRVTE